MKYLAVRNWWKFQNYQNGRSVPWIKLFTGLRSDSQFLLLAEAAQAQLVKLWLLRSECGALPNNPKFLAGMIGTTGKFHLAALIDEGFLVPTDDPEAIEGKRDSKSLDKNEQGDRKSLDKSLDKEYQNISSRARERARDREEVRVESRETTLLTTTAREIDRATRFVAAANRGLAEHPTRPQAVPRLFPGQGATATACEVLAGIPDDFVEAAIYDYAKRHTAARVGSLTYFVGHVQDRWREQQAAESASNATPGGVPTPAAHDPWAKAAAMMRERDEREQREREATHG